jgi:hypothetical protein
MQPQLIPSPKILQLPVLRPPIHRPLICHLHHIHIPSPLHPLFTLTPDRKALPKDLAHLHNRSAPEVEEVVWSHSVVVGYGLYRVLYDFNPPTRLRVFVGLCEEEVPVRYAAEEFANVHKIEMVGREGPLEGHVVNLKVAVRRHPFWLDGGEVGARYCRTGELICDIDAPDACPCADVKDVLRFMSIHIRGAKCGDLLPVDSREARGIAGGRG